MTKQVNCIMLVDDNKIDNFFHERVIRKNDAASVIIKHESAIDALAYLECNAGMPKPDILFLDINMPGMSGWEFIGEYKKIDRRNDTLVVVFTGDDDPDDEALEATKGVFADFRPKPLTKEMLHDVLEKYHSKR